MSLVSAIMYKNIAVQHTDTFMVYVHVHHVYNTNIRQFSILIYRPASFGD